MCAADRRPLGRCSALPASSSAPPHASTPTSADSCPEAVASSSGRQARELFQISEAAAPAAPPSSSPEISTIAGAAAGLGLAAFALNKYLERGARPYEVKDGVNSVGAEYDRWTNDGILEYYWGEHIHLGYYTEAERAAGYRKKDFKQAKYDFCDEMLKFSQAKSPKSILDVGCGFGGTSRHLGKLFPEAKVEGITLSPAQVARGMELCKERGLSNVTLKVKDALAMDYPDNSFDLVWACESGEHMPDKKKYIEEMVRVLKPGGRLVIACWCEREETPERPFTPEEKKQLQFLYDEWSHPYFISIEEFVRLMKGTGQLEDVVSEDWTAQTLPDWHHNIWHALKDPWYLFARPHTWVRTFRDVIGILRMHDGFAAGLMQYGMMTGRKALPKK